jgi:hypothetical protein
MPTFSSVAPLLRDPSCEQAGTPRDVLGFDSCHTEQRHPGGGGVRVLTPVSDNYDYCLLERDAV